MTERIPSYLIRERILQHLVRSPSNPGRCTCGMYLIFYECGHQYVNWRAPCGINSVCYELVFCSEPAPRVRVNAFVITDSRRDCGCR
ncbi:hypothetical protein QBC46DRAFT_391769 [Diplogelasinospora grovesii]|uniref:Uncharacterized protein n=1 Tax=Diplogelasinospora grovesii TaxID=303347 RepID=A0AAN6S1L1_9PEZI|nr:hypothetical protein QBC46DRAFT_391769 [Diplogelasinospora grovesii]